VRVPSPSRDNSRACSSRGWPLGNRLVWSRTEDRVNLIRVAPLLPDDGEATGGAGVGPRDPAVGRQRPDGSERAGTRDRAGFHLGRVQRAAGACQTTSPSPSSSTARPGRSPRPSTAVPPSDPVADRRRPSTSVCLAVLFQRVHTNSDRWTRPSPTTATSPDGHLPVPRLLMSQGRRTGKTWTACMAWVWSSPSSTRTCQPSASSSARRLMTGPARSTCTPPQRSS
jgi:hypothetical protein